METSALIQSEVVIRTLLLVATHRYSFFSNPAGVYLLATPHPLLLFDTHRYSFLASARRWIYRNPQHLRATHRYPLATPLGIFFAHKTVL